jgi:hypothetical protein
VEESGARVCVETSGLAPDWLLAAKEIRANCHSLGRIGTGSKCQLLIVEDANAAALPA